jgi:hypothetical protein
MSLLAQFKLHQALSTPTPNVQTPACRTASLSPRAPSPFQMSLRRARSESIVEEQRKKRLKHHAVTVCKSLNLPDDALEDFASVRSYNLPHINSLLKSS